jgi:hypothetical protein
MVKKLLDKYYESLIPGSLENLAPFIGGSLDSLLSIKGSIWREERIKALLSYLDEKITELEDPGILEQLSNSEEFHDLMIQSIDAVIKTRHNEKIKGYGNILINNLTDPSRGIYSELFITILDSLTLKEIEYLLHLKSSSNELTFYKINGLKIIWPIYLANIEQTGREEIPDDSILKFNSDVIWKILANKSLIAIDVKKDFHELPYHYETNMQSKRSSISASEKTSYRITEFGSEFMKSVIS